MTSLDSVMDHTFEFGSENLFTTMENREIADFPPPCVNDSPLGGVLALIRKLLLE